MLVVVYAKLLNGELFGVEIDQNLSVDDFIRRLCNAYPDVFKYGFTRIVGEIHLPWQGEDVVNVLIDEAYQLRFPLIGGVPKSFETCIFHKIPNNLVKIVQKNIQDERGITMFMKVEWRDESGRYHSGYVEQPSDV
jgi:hypothetical protein